MTLNMYHITGIVELHVLYQFYKYYFTVYSYAMYCEI